jgi:hypothetical protein
LTTEEGRRKGSSTAAAAAAAPEGIGKGIGRIEVKSNRSKMGGVTRNSPGNQSDGTAIGRSEESRVFR